jgi:dolichyl-phosphate-mannose--protein O-mannosyl transferase
MVMVVVAADWLSLLILVTLVFVIPFAGLLLGFFTTLENQQIVMSSSLDSDFLPSLFQSYLFHYNVYQNTTPISKDLIMYFSDLEDTTISQIVEKYQATTRNLSPSLILPTTLMKNPG